MDFGLATQDTKEARPLWLVDEQALDTWRARLPAAAARWVTESGFQAEAQRLVLLPGPSGEILGAALGLGKAGPRENLDPWCLASAQDKLPAGAW